MDAVVEPRGSLESLEAKAKRRFGHIPSPLIVSHVLGITPKDDFAVQSAALEALIRRMSFALRDGLEVSARPKKTSLGSYQTRGKDERRARRSTRPYATEIESIEPLRGSCDCPDFVRSSLGLCKHLLAVLDWLHAKPTRLRSAEQSLLRSGSSAHLGWDFRTPLAGAADRLAGLSMQGAIPKSLAPAFDRRGHIVGRRLGSARARLELMRVLARLLGERAARLSATPAARAVVLDELARAERRARAEAAAKPALRTLSSLERKLYPYQREGVERFLRAGRLLLADDMGLGKTTQAVAACHALFRARRVRRGLLIVPAALKSQWLREWQSTTSVPAVVVEGTPAERARTYASKEPGFFILSYEQLLRDFERIRATAPDIVVLDEAQRIKNWATKSAAFVKALDPEYRLVLTGTPMENRLEELASIFDFVDDLCLAPKWRLEAAYGMPSAPGATDTRTGARNLATLRARMAPALVRRVRREVLSQLPPRTDTRVPVAMTEQQRDEHDALAQPIAEIYTRSRKRPLTQAEFLRLMQLLTTQRIISNGLGQLRFDELWPTYRTARPDAALLEGLFSPKLHELRGLIEDLAVSQQRKVVIFSQWRSMLRLADWSARDILGGSGASAVFFTGAESQAQRSRAIVDFHERPDVRVMFLSDAGGVGLNLQRAASACINLELPWNPAVLEQRISRIYRLGQKAPIDVYNLVNEYGIEARIANVLGTKRALFASVFDGTSDEVSFDGSTSFMARLERLVDLPAVPGPAQATTSPAEADDFEPDPVEVVADRASEPEMRPDAPPGPLPDVASLLRALRIERTATGALRIEAPPDAASALVAMFEGMARLVSSASGPPVGPPPAS